MYCLCRWDGQALNLILFIWQLWLKLSVFQMFQNYCFLPESIGFFIIGITLLQATVIVKYKKFSKNVNKQNDISSMNES